MRPTISAFAILTIVMGVHRLDAQSIHPRYAFRALNYNLHAHGATGDADSQHTDTPPSSYEWWEQVQTPSVVGDGATATATTLHRSSVRDGAFDGRARLSLETTAQDAGENASASADSYMDAQDLAILQACQSGPAVPYNPLALPVGCPLLPDATGHIAADLDQDGDVDQVDFGILQRCYSIASFAADPNCGN